MTGYYLSIGYNSSWLRDDAWGELKAVVERLRRMPDAIIAEVHRERGDYASETLREYADLYGADEDLTVKVHEPEGDKEGRVVQMASGGGESRDIKEAMRRAFCRLVMFEMHKLGIEISMDVV